MVAGLRRPRTASTPSQWHAPVHPFLAQTSEYAQNKIALVSFGTQRQSHGEFVDYATRYGSIRDDDKVTLMESLMASCDVYIGAVARQRCRPDPLLPPDSSTTGLLKWESNAVRDAKRAEALEVRSRIMALAPALNLSSLLSRPMIALSNGQTRRARILRALISGAELVVLDEPYTGLDTDTRQSISAFFAERHAARHPRLCFVLREQDELPSLVTHVLRIDEHGAIIQRGSRHEVPQSGGGAPYPAGGKAQVAALSARGMGRGSDDDTPVVQLRDVSIAYGATCVLNHVSLALPPGARMVLVGENGSGKTTLLSLLLGDHPRSFALPASQLTLFGEARDAPRNAHVLLQKKVGHLSPELYNAFPRRSLESGGLSVLEAVTSGFDGIFTRRQRSPAELARARQLLEVMAGELQDDGMSVDELAERPFAELAHGAQALVLLLRAVVHRPALLVLDEPFQGMSVRQSARARAFLDAMGADSWVLEGMTPHERDKELAWRKRMVMIVVSHYESEWPLSCGRYLRLAKGDVVEQW